MRVTELDTLLKVLRSPVKSQRAEAVERLVDLGPLAVGGLISQLKDPSWVVRYRSCEALGRIGDRRSVFPLREALVDEKDHVRYMAAKALGQLGGGDSAPYLVLLLGDENACVRKSTAVALGAIGAREACAPLQAALQNETSRQVREVMESVLTALMRC